MPAEIAATAARPMLAEADSALAPSSSVCATPIWISASWSNYEAIDSMVSPSVCLT